MGNWKTIFFSLASLFLLVAFVTSCSGSYFSRYSTGPIQVIGSKDELRIYWEFDQIVSQSKSFYDAPNAFPVGHFQELLIISRAGVKGRVQVKIKNNKCGVTFHPNNSLIFAEGDNVYLYLFPSMYYQESLFQWNEVGSTFDILPLENSKEFLEKNFKSRSYNEKIAAMKKLSAKSGWVPLYSDKSIGRDNFIWENILFSISINDQGAFFEVNIVASESIEGFPLTLKYRKDIKTMTHSEFKLLSREETGHPKL